jgi:hypothetical protein
MHPVLRRTVVVAGAGAGVIAVRRLTTRQLGNGTTGRPATAGTR